MFKIAILGCENSHANGFLSQIKEGLFPEVEVIGIYSDEREPAEKLSETYGVPVMNDYAELAGKVDGIMITARHGDNHLKYAVPYMPYGIPMFVDKPITVKPDEAIELVNKAKKYGNKICGGSSCIHIKQTVELKEYFRNLTDDKVIGGTVVCPIVMESPYGGFYFYAQHLIQIMMEIFGENPRNVTANEVGEQIYMIVEYDDFAVTATYSKELPHYYAEVITRKGVKSKELIVDNECFVCEMKEMDDLLHGKKMKVSYDSFIRPVFVMDAIMKSLNNKEKVQIVFPASI